MNADAGIVVNACQQCISGEAIFIFEYLFEFLMIVFLYITYAAAAILN